MERCAICGSSNIIVETKKEGYNKKKGIIGSFLFGNIGLIAGVNENKVDYYTCRNCTKTMTTLMSKLECDNVEEVLNELQKDDCSEYVLQKAEKLVQKYSGLEWSKLIESKKNELNEKINRDTFIENKNKQSLSDEEQQKIVNYIKSNSELKIDDLLLFMNGIREIVICEFLTNNDFIKTKVNVIEKDNEIYLQYFAEQSEESNEQLLLRIKNNQSILKKYVGISTEKSMSRSREKEREIILDILIDEQKSLSLEEIMKIMNEKYDLYMPRQTLSANLKKLSDDNLYAERKVVNKNFVYNANITREKIEKERNKVKEEEITISIESIRKGNFNTNEKSMILNFIINKGKLNICELEPITKGLSRFLSNKMFNSFFKECVSSGEPIKYIEDDDELVVHYNDEFAGMNDSAESNIAIIDEYLPIDEISTTDTNEIQKYNDKVINLILEILINEKKVLSLDEITKILKEKYEVSDTERKLIALMKKLKDKGYIEHDEVNKVHLCKAIVNQEQIEKEKMKYEKDMHEAENLSISDLEHLMSVIFEIRRAEEEYISVAKRKTNTIEIAKNKYNIELNSALYDFIIRKL